MLKPVSNSQDKKQTDYRYTIYQYTDEFYGSTGISFPEKSKSIEKIEELERETGLKYGIFLEYKEDDVYHRRLVWKNGEDVKKTYKKRISSTANYVLVFIKGYYSSKRSYPTFDEIKNEIQKHDFDVIRVMKILLEADLVTFSPPFNKKTTYKLKK